MPYLKETWLCPYPACLQGRDLPAACRELMTRQPDILPTCLSVQTSQLQLQQLRHAVALFDGDLIKAYLLLEIASRHPHAQQQYRHQAHDYPFSNIHSLSTATGYPRETVRRKVLQMVEEGQLERLPDGGLILSAMTVQQYQQDTSQQQVALLLQTAGHIRSLQQLAAAAAGE